MEEKKEETKPKILPIRKYKAGSMSLSVFEHTHTTAEDKTFVTESYVLQRSYQDKEGNWNNPNLSLKKTDLPKALSILRRAYDESFNQTTEAEA